MFAHDMTSSSSFTGCGLKSRGTFTHAAGSTSAFVAPICDCGHFAVLRTATTEKNVGKRFWGCPKYIVNLIQSSFMQTGYLNFFIVKFYSFLQNRLQVALF